MNNQESGLDPLKKKQLKIADRIKEARQQLRELGKQMKPLRKQRDNLEILEQAIHQFIADTRHLKPHIMIGRLLDLPVHKPIVAHLFPKKQSLITREVALLKLEAFLCQLAARKMPLDRQLEPLVAQEKLWQEVIDLNQKVKLSVRQKAKDRLRKQREREKKALAAARRKKR
jgi:hypothetical protein